jgi:hypothetical protein
MTFLMVFEDRYYYGTDYHFFARVAEQIAYHPDVARVRQLD